MAWSSRERIYLKVIPAKQVIEAETQAENERPLELLPQVMADVSAPTQKSLRSVKRSVRLGGGD